MKKVKRCRLCNKIITRANKSGYCYSCSLETLNNKSRQMTFEKQYREKVARVRKFNGQESTNSDSVQKASCESLKSMNQSKVESIGMKDESTTYFLNNTNENKNGKY